MQTTTRDINITIRTHAKKRDFLTRAAQVAGQSRSDFMLEAATEKAENVLKDQTHFVLNEEQWDAFIQVLDNPPKPNKNFERLMATPLPWNR